MESVSSFLSIFEELVGQDKVLNESEKVTKILRTLPTSLNAFEMASSLKNSFYDIISVVQANIELRRKLRMVNKNSSNSCIAGPSSNLVDGTNRGQYFASVNLGRGRGRGRRRVNRGNRGRGGRGKSNTNDQA